MCNTDLTIAFINGDIKINDLRGKILVKMKRIASLQGRICRIREVIFDEDDIPSEVARLERNIAAAQLDIANLKYEIACEEANLREIVQEIEDAEKETGMFDALFGDVEAKMAANPAVFGFGEVPFGPQPRRAAKEPPEKGVPFGISEFLRGLGDNVRIVHLNG